jgi:hypothetical protein
MGVFDRIFAAQAVEGRLNSKRHGACGSRRFHGELSARGIAPCIPSTRGRKRSGRHFVLTAHRGLTAGDEQV